MTRAKDISKIVTDADLSGTLDVAGNVTVGSGSNTTLSIDSSSAFDASLTTDGANQALNIIGTNNSSNGNVYIKTGGTGTPLTRARFNPNGDISFYEDTGTTPKLFWDANEERLGIGTSSPFFDLELNKSSAPTIRIEETTNSVRLDLRSNSDHTLIRTTSNHDMRFNTNQFDRMTIKNNGNVGIGTISPSVLLEVNGSSGIISRFQSSSGNLQVNMVTPNINDAIIAFGDTSNYRASIAVDTSDAITFQTSSSLTERMRIDNDGNVGIGAVPNTSIDTLRTLQIGNGGSIMSHISSTNSLYASSNAYYASGWKYINAGTATEYKAINGEHVWSNASSGSANGAITWSEAMRITSGGNVGIGTDSPATDLEVSGSILTSSSFNLNSLSVGSLAYFSYSNGNPRLWNTVNGALVFGTNNTERMRILPSGGITFNGDTATANALDDYEEGNWIPSNSANFNITSIQNATYTKVGRVVTINAWLKVSITASNPVLGGLPFSISGRTSASMSNVTRTETLANQALGTNIYTYGVTSGGTSDDVLFSLSYNTT